MRRARLVQSRLESLGHQTALIEIRTAGDKCRDDHIAAPQARSFFTHELETALLRNKADLAVHALPDVSTDQAAGLVIAAVLRRDDPRDAIVLNALLEATTLSELPRGTSVGSSCVRVRSLLRALYPELDIVHLRGDLPARLHKVDSGQAHATVVPAASLGLLGVTQLVAGFPAAPDWLPAPGQGAIAVQAREGDTVTREKVAALEDPPTRRQVLAERAVLGALEGGLQSPVGALVLEDTLHAVIASQDGRRILRAERPLAGDDPELVGIRVANDLRARSASAILDELRRAERIPTPQPE